MSNKREFDIVIFGASGHIGRYVMEELAHSASAYSIKWAIAGKNLDKLKDTVTIVQQYLGKDFDIQNIPLIYANAQNVTSLYKMCERTKLLLNCVGPYTLHSGELIVETCIETNTHCVDISAEVKYLESIQIKYFKLAQEKKVFVVEACGFGSLPADYGISVLKNSFPGELNAVEYFIKLIDGPKGRSTNMGTFESMLYTVKDYIFYKKHDKLLKIFFKKSLPRPTYPQLRKNYRGFFPFYNENVRSYCLNYVGPDRSVLKRSEMLRYEIFDDTPVQSVGYLESSFGKCLFYMLLFFSTFLMSFSKIGKSLLMKYPAIFTMGEISKTGPTREQVLSGRTRFTFFGTGWINGLDKNSEPRSKIKLTIYGPEAAYPFTAICMVQAGITVLQEMDKLPLEGGVFTPGVAFEKTTLQKRLENRGIKFDIETDL